VELADGFEEESVAGESEGEAWGAEDSGVDASAHGNQDGEQHEGGSGAAHGGFGDQIGDTLRPGNCGDGESAKISHVDQQVEAHHDGHSAGERNKDILLRTLDFTGNESEDVPTFIGPKTRGHGGADGCPCDWAGVNRGDGCMGRM
jgi:hypothetical protein